MRVALTVIVYDRETNLRAWCRAWSLVKDRHSDVDFRVIHNTDAADERAARFREAVESVGGLYIGRKNVGYDIGALQDVARKRLNFPAYDYLLWCVDDLMPMHDGFLSAYLQTVDKNRVNVFEVSQKPVAHVRTTGLFMHREIVERLSFTADPVTTKQHCYEFEHRAVNRHFLAQMLAGAHAVRQIAAPPASPLWDTGRARGHILLREKEFASGWPEVYAEWVKGGQVVDAAPVRKDESRVLIFSTAYKRHPIVAHSLKLQTHKDWRLVIEHDGEPDPSFLRALPDDLRIVLSWTKEREQNFGHPKRARFLSEIAAKYPDTDFVMITNDDNYYTPQFLERAVKTLREHPNAQAAYCDMVSNYITYGVLPSRPARGFIDCGSVMFRTRAAVSAPWPSNEHSADWFWFDKVARASGGFSLWKKFQGVHFVHN